MRLAKNCRRTRELAFAVASVAASLAMLGAGRAASAANQYWDGDGMGTVSGGPGNWNATGLNWGGSAGASTFGAFGANDTAIFGGSGSYVAIDGSVAGNMDFQSNGYIVRVVTGGSFAWPDGTSGVAGNVNVASGIVAELRSALSTTAGASLGKSGAGTLLVDAPFVSDGSIVNINEGTLKLGQVQGLANSFFGGSGGNAGSNKTVVNLAGGATLDMGKNYDWVGRLSGAGTIVLGSHVDSRDMVTAGQSFTFGSSLVMNADNTQNSSTYSANTSTFSGNIVDDGKVSVNAPFSGGHLIIGTPSTTGSLGATVTLSGNNTFHGIVALTIGSTLYVQGGHAIPDTAPVVLTMAGSTAMVAPLFELQDDETIGSLSSASGGQSWVNPNGHTLTLGGNNLNSEYSGQIGPYVGEGTTTDGTIVKIGTGKQFINTASTSPSSTFTGKYVIKGGMLAAGNDPRWGVVPGSLVPNYFTLDGGTLGMAVLTSWSGLTLAPTRGIYVTNNGGGLYYNNPQNQALTIQGPITGTGTLTRSGPAIVALQNDNSGFSGNWEVVDGSMTMGNPTSTSAYWNKVGLGNMAAGTGSMHIVHAGVQFLAQSNIGGAGATDQTYNIAGGAGSKLTYGEGAIITLNKNSNHSLTVTVGDAAATNGSAFVRQAGGSMLVMATNGPAKLGTGTGETLMVNGGISTVETNGGANTMIPAMAISTSTSATEGFFATYDATPGVGLKTATMSAKADINTADATDVFNAVNTTVNPAAVTSLSGDRSAYAMKIGGGGTAAGAATVDLNGHTLHLGGSVNSDPAMLIVSNGSGIASTNGGVLDFGAHEGLIYAENSAGAINATITGSAGLSKMGMGTVSLGTSTLSYTGMTRLEQGGLTIGTANQLPANTDLVFAGTAPVASGNPALNLNGFTVSVNSVKTLTQGSAVAAGAAGGGVINLGKNGVLKITGSGDSLFNGTLSRDAASTATTIWNAGSGTLQIGMADAVYSDRGTIMSYDKLLVTNGGTIALDTYGGLSSYPIAASTVVADTYKLDNGTLRFTGIQTSDQVNQQANAGRAFGLGAASSSGMVWLTINANRGMTVGSGGGTIQVDSPYTVIDLNGANGKFGGTGTLTKTGPGYLSLPATMTAGAAWKLNVKGGAVIFTGATDAGMGDVPTVLDPTNITLDGGTLDVNQTGAESTVTLSATRGIFIGAGGGTISHARGAFQIDGPLSGSGPLRIAYPANTAGNLSFTAPSDGSLTGGVAYTGTVTLAQYGAAYVRANNALGTGTITNDPAYATSFGSDFAGTVALSNHFVINSGDYFQLNVANAATDLVLTGQVSGTPSWTVVGTTGGVLELANATNNFSGDVNVTSASLAASVNGALGPVTGRIIASNTGGVAFKGNVNYTSPKPVFISGASTTGSIGNVSGNNSFAGPVTMTGSATVGSTADTLTLTGGINGAADSMLTKVGAGTVVLGGSVNYKGNTVVSAGTLAYASSFTSPGSLNVADGATAAITLSGGTARLLSVAGLNLNASGTLDLTDNDLAVRYSADSRDGVLASVATYIKAAYDRGAWDQTGITTSLVKADADLGTTLGYADDAANSRVLVRYTWLGDRDLNGVVNAADLPIAGGTVWSDGDFNYDGRVSADDYALYRLGMAKQTGTLHPVVPEPAGLGLVMAGGALALRRRRR